MKIIEFLSKHDWLGHIVEALVMTAIGTALVMLHGSNLLLSILIGGAFAAGHFHGREKRDYEVSVAMKPPHLQAYKIWLWSKDQLTDFLPVAAIYLAFFAWVFWRG